MYVGSVQEQYGFGLSVARLSGKEGMAGSLAGEARCGCNSLGRTCNVFG